MYVYVLCDHTPCCSLLACSVRRGCISMYVYNVCANVCICVVGPHNKMLIVME